MTLADLTPVNLAHQDMRTQRSGRVSVVGALGWPKFVFPDAANLIGTDTQSCTLCARNSEWVSVILLTLLVVTALKIAQFAEVLKCLSFRPCDSALEAVLTWI